MLRLNGSASAVAAAGELLEQLKKENADLSADNERLLNYVESLESTQTEGFASGTELSWHLSRSAAVRAFHDGRLLLPETSEFLMSCGMTGTPRGHRKLLENFVQLKVDNKVLSDENARLGAELAEVQHARGSVTTVPVPGKPTDQP